MLWKLRAAIFTMTVSYPLPIYSFDFDSEDNLDYSPSSEHDTDPEPRGVEDSSWCYILLYYCKYYQLHSRTRMYEVVYIYAYLVV
jgi:hypothetical protein